MSPPNIGTQYLCYSVWKLFEKSRYYETFLTISAKTDYPSIPKIDNIKTKLDSICIALITDIKMLKRVA